MGATVRGNQARGGGQPQDQRLPPLKIIQELEKQYDVETIQAQNKIQVWLDDSEASSERVRQYDVLLAVQPSKMNPTELRNLIEAIQLGQPTVIFEDPLPWLENFGQHVKGTLTPRVVNRVGTETADIQELWDALDLNIDQQTFQDATFPYMVWQLESKNPYPRDPQLKSPYRVIVHEDDAIADPRFSDHPITRGIDELYFQFTGYLRSTPNSALHFEPLVQTGSAGNIWLRDFLFRPLRHRTHAATRFSQCSIRLGCPHYGGQCSSDVERKRNDERRSSD